MSQSIRPLRAIYSAGQLRLIDPVDLREGQEIQLMILSDEERVQAAIGDLLVNIPDYSDDDLDEEALAREIEEGFRGHSLSDTIIQERREGP